MKKIIEFLRKLFRVTPETNVITEEIVENNRVAEEVKVEKTQVAETNTAETPAVTEEISKDKPKKKRAPRKKKVTE